MAGIRWQRQPLDENRALLSILGVALLVALFIAARVHFDGLTAFKAFLDVAENIGILVLLGAIPGYVGFLLGRKSLKA